jgi:hypothetical protein
VKQHCGRVPLHKAVHLFAMTTTVRGLAIVGSGLFSSDAGYPVVVTAVSGGPGVSVVLDRPLPLRLAPNATLDTALTLRISSCSALLSRARAQAAGSKALVIGDLRGIVVRNGSTATFNATGVGSVADDLLTVFKKQSAGGVA